MVRSRRLTLIAGVHSLINIRVIILRATATGCEQQRGGANGHDGFHSFIL